jgi:hypothetical protein
MPNYPDKDVTAFDVVSRINRRQNARPVWHEAIEALADGLITAQALFDVSVLVLGGGLAEAGDTLLVPLNSEMEKRLTFHRMPKIVKAALGDTAGCKGAALLALDHLEHKREDQWPDRPPGRGDPGHVEIDGPTIIDVSPTTGRRRHRRARLRRPALPRRRRAHLHHRRRRPGPRRRRVPPRARHHHDAGQPGQLAVRADARRHRRYLPLVRERVLAGVHYEGPYLSGARCGAQNPEFLRDPSVAELTELIKLGEGAVRMVTIAPELPGATEAIALLRAHGVLAAIGHTDATYEQAKAGIAAGGTVGTHLFNGMRPPHHREPGPVVGLLDSVAVCELIADNIHLHPGMLAFAARAAGPDRAALITDAMDAPACRTATTSWAASRSWWPTGWPGWPATARSRAAR